MTFIRSLWYQAGASDTFLLTRYIPLDSLLTLIARAGFEPRAFCMCRHMEHLSVQIEKRSFSFRVLDFMVPCQTL